MQEEKSIAAVQGRYRDVELAEGNGRGNGEGRTEWEAI